jgi:hypothetical protein
MIKGIIAFDEWGHNLHTYKFEMSGRSVESASMIERVVLSKWPAVD